MTLLRSLEHASLRGIPLSGKILDIGGDKRSEYLGLFTGEFSITTLNIVANAKPDIVADAEKPLPIKDAAYEGALLINVLEHVFEYRALLNECARILVPGSPLIVVVPFLFPYHPSPSDYHRYSKETLQRALSLSGFDSIEIRALGTGVFSARYLFLERLLPPKVQSVISFVMHPLVRTMDATLLSIARILHKKYDPADYALGFRVIAKKAA